MGKFYWYACTLAMLSLLLTSSNAQWGKAKPLVSRTTKYEDVLGESWNDSRVQDLIRQTNCVRNDQLISCSDAGMALWLDSHETVKTIYLYLNNTDDFSPYRGELPFGLKFYDNMEAVEYKLNRQGVGNRGLPDSDSFSMHLQYWAFYQKRRLMIIYNSPFANDDNASIYAIAISR